MKIDNSKKITFEEYKKNYTKPQNTKLIKWGFFLLSVTIGVVIATCLSLVVLKVFEFNNIAGYISIAVAVLLFVFLYIIPIIKITKIQSFQTNVDEVTGAKAKKANKKLREDIADMMIDVVSKVNDISWYSREKVGQLAIARQTKNNELLKETLTDIYNTDVKKIANKMIVDNSIRTGLLTALSQSDKIDTAIVTLTNLNLIKNIVYLYGFRPSESKMVKIYESVLVSALSAYGISATSEGIVTGVINVFSKEKSIPIISSVAGSAIQGLANATFTFIIGKQTKRYLMKEYHIQNILDSFEFENEEDDEEMMKEIKKGIVKSSKNKKD